MGACLCPHVLSVTSAPPPTSSFSASVSPTRLSEAQGLCLLRLPLSLCWLFLGCEGLGGTQLDSSKASTESGGVVGMFS